MLQDEVTIKTLHCLGFFNNRSFNEHFEDIDVIYKTNETVFLSGNFTITGSPSYLLHI